MSKDYSKSYYCCYYTRVTIVYESRLIRVKDEGSVNTVYKATHHIPKSDSIY